MKKRMQRSQLVTLRVPKEILKSLDMLALEQERYRSEIMVDAFKTYLRQEAAHRSAGKVAGKNQSD